MRRACVLSGVGVDGYMGGPGCTLHCFSALIIVLHIGCVMLGSFSVMYIRG